VLGLRVLPVLACALSVACGNSGGAPEQSFGGRGRVATTRGSAVAVTYDERVAVVANRTNGVVSVHPLTPGEGAAGAIGPGVEIPVHPLDQSKPWAVVTAADDDTAYVLLRGLGQVMRVEKLHGGKPVETGRVSVGADPTAIAISPSGKKLYVANFGDGSISVILTAIFQLGAESHAKWDLNLRLAKTGLLGPLVASGEDTGDGFWTETELLRFRPGLAHPRALAMTDDGDKDDDDETLYATEFFSQPVADLAITDPDRNRQGIIYPIVVGIGAGQAPPDEVTGEPVDVIALPPVETGIVDVREQPTACVPNQLYSITADRDRLLVTSLCASPAGPVEGGKGRLASNNFKTLVHPAIFAIDQKSHRAVAEQALLFPRLLEAQNEAEAVAAEHRRMPLIPNDIVASAEGADERRAYVTAMAAGALFPVTFEADGALRRIGISGAPAPSIDIGVTSMPTGVALLRSRPWALVVDDRKPSLTVVDLEASREGGSSETVVTDWGSQPGVDPNEVPSRAAREGRRLFATGLEVWSLSGQAWSSCESCHPDGLSDGLTWRFARGPRRTISTAGTYRPGDPQRRVLLWTANVDEIHDVEGIARGLSGGVGGVLWNPYAAHPDKSCRLLFDGGMRSDQPGACPGQKTTTLRHNGLNGSLTAITANGDDCDPAQSPCDVNASSDWNDIDAFIRTVNAPTAPRRCTPGDLACLDPAAVESGRNLFLAARCAACHGGPAWTVTRMFYEPSPTQNGAIPYANPGVVTDRAAMLGVLRVSRYQAPNDLLRSLNAPLAKSADGTAPFRPGPPGDATDAAFLDYFYPPPGPAPLDQINCALRTVGTFPAQTADAAPNFAGITPRGVHPIVEERLTLPAAAPAEGALDTYEVKLAIGETGFNVPSLVGLASSGPYFHAGNARTLEELFDPIFSAHHAAMVPAFQPTASEIRDLVAFLLAIDERGTVEPIDPTTDLGVNPDLCVSATAN